MAKRRSRSEHRQLTKREMQDLARFGCVFKVRPGIFYIRWQGERVEQASTTPIFACLGRIGPIVLVAFEISPVRPLPYYAYFPFDLKNQGHRKFVSGLTETGKIRLSLLVGKRTFQRTHQLTPYLRLRATEIYSETLEDYEKQENGEYDFGQVLQALEKGIRIPSLVERLLLEDTLREVAERMHKAASAAPGELREFARRILTYRWRATHGL